MMASRIQQARLASGLSLSDVAERLRAGGIRITKAALSNYERGKRRPAPDVLRGLGRALGVASAYFIREPAAAVEWLAFRRTTRLGVRQMETIKAHAQMAAERATALFDLLPNAAPITFPERRRVETLEEVDRAAAELRSEWGLGDAPIECVCRTAEDNGAVVVPFEREETTAFDGLSGSVNGHRPLLTVNTAMPTDRLRFNLAHEIGHHVLAPGDLTDDARLYARIRADT